MIDDFLHRGKVNLRQEISGAPESIINRTRFDEPNGREKDDRHKHVLAECQVGVQLIVNTHKLVGKSGRLTLEV